MKRNCTYLFILFFFSTTVFAQEWQQTASTPEGGGITEIVVHPDNNNIFVTTASYNWPNGDDGGIRRSINDGDTWENLFDAFTGRTITFGADGNLYASVWPYPSDEGLYRSTNNGDTWDLLITVPSGNNIFSITVNINIADNTILAGTRQGVYRSLDNGVTWAYASNGIPPNSWVRDIEVDSTGIIVAATTNGLFSSEDNGGLWEQATGAGIENDTITKIIFAYPFDSKDNNTRLLAGSNDGNIYESFSQSKYLNATMCAIFSSSESSGMFIAYLGFQNKKMHGISRFPKGTQPGGFDFSADNGTTWQQNNSGLPGTSLPLSALSGSSTPIDIKLNVGLFQNMNGGAKVFKITYDWSTIIGVEDHVLNSSSGLNLCQNFPNPFDHTTLISYYLEHAGQASLKVYASDGHLVSTLLDSWQSNGEHQLTFNAESMEGGIYYYKLESEGLSEVRKMIILK